MAGVNLHPKIIDLKICANFILIASFNDGSVKEFDFKPLLKKESYKDLNNPLIFGLGRIDAGGYGISWTDFIDIDSYDIWMGGKIIETSQKKPSKMINKEKKSGVRA